MWYREQGSPWINSLSLLSLQITLLWEKMSKINSFGAFLLFCYLDFQLKSLRCGYKTTLIYNSRSSGLTWAFHFLWEMSMHYPPAVKRWEKEKHDSRPWGAPEASAWFPHSPHTRCLLPADASTAGTQCWSGPGAACTMSRSSSLDLPESVPHLGTCCCCFSSKILCFPNIVLPDAGFSAHWLSFCLV